MEITREQERLIVVGGLGILVGVSLSLGVDSLNSHTREALAIESDSLPALVKVYNDFSKDDILVENPAKAGQYIALSQYLENQFDNKYERNIERNRIELLVSQKEGGSQ